MKRRKTRKWRLKKDKNLKSRDKNIPSKAKALHSFMRDFKTVLFHREIAPSWHFSVLISAGKKKKPPDLVLHRVTPVTQDKSLSKVLQNSFNLHRSHRHRSLFTGGPRTPIILWLHRHLWFLWLSACPPVVSFAFPGQRAKTASAARRRSMLCAFLVSFLCREKFFLCQLFARCQRRNIGVFVLAATLR